MNYIKNLPEPLCAADELNSVSDSISADAIRPGRFLYFIRICIYCDIAERIRNAPAYFRLRYCTGVMLYIFLKIRLKCSTF